MNFDPKPDMALSIEGSAFKIAEHPAAPGIAFGQEGRAAVVYKLESAQGARALKVFKPRFRTPGLASLANRLAPYAAIPGLTVCRRSVLTPQQHNTLLRQFPELTYSVLMPWIDGPTWMQILQEKPAFSPAQSLDLALSFARILSEMEQQGVAHCDLSAANLIVPALAPDSKSTSYAPIELVDVEQVYAKNLDQPEAVPSGSDGYAHKTVRQEKIWNAKVDRFAGAILLSEMLGWCDPDIQVTAWGESYFDPQELQRTSRRCDLLRQSLSTNWGDSATQLLDRAWNSELVDDCPTFGEWLVALPETAPEVPVKAQKLSSGSAAKPEPAESSIATLLGAAERLAAQGNKAGALEIYRQAIALAPSGSPLLPQIQAMIQSLEWIGPANTTETNWVDSTKTAAPIKQSACPYCETPLSEGANTCPQCGKLLGKSTGNEIHQVQRFDQPERKTARPVKTWGIIAAVVVILGVILAVYQLSGVPSAAPAQPATAVSASEVTAAPTNTAAPAAISVEQPTTAPTSTSEPLPTTAPTLAVVAPEILNSHFTGLNITRLDTFDSKAADLAFNDQNTKVQDGELSLSGHDYSGGIEGQKLYKEGQGVVFDFKLSKDQPSPDFAFEARFDAGSKSADDYRRASVYLFPAPMVSTFQGFMGGTDGWMATTVKNGKFGYLAGNLVIKTNVWYSLMIAIGKGGDSFGIIWDPQNPSKTLRFHRTSSQDWSSREWKFTLDGGTGNLEIDNWMDISFDSFSE